MEKANFSDYQLSNELLKSISMLNFKSPSSVQEKVIPTILEKKDMIIKSQTGSGKTAAFSIPICELIDWEENKAQALVMVPTRELAMQVKEDIFNIGRFKRIKVSALYGGASFYNQEKELKQKTHVVVGTPGRIMDHIEKGTFDLSEIKYLIVDEADEMFKMGFVDQINSILTLLPKDRVTVVLSATMPKDMDLLCHKHLKNPIYVEIEEHNPAIDRINQGRYSVSGFDKMNLLKDLTIIENPDSCIIFCNTKDMVDEVYHELKKLKYPLEKLHGGMEQRDRLKVMNRFKKGQFRYLIATDVAARGIDIDNITLVINFEVPQDVENYVHRIGRTGRMDNPGRAITFASSKEKRYLENIEQYIGKEIPIMDRPQQETVHECKEEFIRKTNTAPDIKEAKDAQLSKEIVKLHINAGKKTKMRAVDIVGTLCNIEGMTAADIGVINIMDISTYVEILNNKGELVCQELQKLPIKGRLRKVSKANVI